MALGKIAGLYDRDENLLSKSTVDELPGLFQVATVCALLVWLAEGAFVEGRLERAQVMALWALLFLGLGLARAVARRIVLRSAPSERCLVLGEPCNGRGAGAQARSGSLINATVVGYIPLDGDRRHEELPPPPAGSLPVLGSLTDVAGALWTHRIDRVVIDSSTTPAGDGCLDKIRLIESVGVKVTLLPRLLEVVGWSVALDEVEGTPLLGVRGYGLTHSSRLLKRSFDVCGSLAALIVFAPLLAAIAVAIKLSSRGPVLFRQRRVGRGGEPFNLLKFRTMRQGADAQKPSFSRSTRRSAFQDRERPARHARGRLLRQPLARRAAAARERAARGDEPGRTAAARGRGGQPGARLAAPPPRRHPGHDRRLAGAGLGPHPAARDGEARLPLPRQLVALARPEDPDPHGPLRPRPTWPLSAPSPAS